MAPLAEYLPPFPLKLEARCFAGLEQSTGYRLDSKLRAKTNEAATHFLEDLCRDDAQPSAKDVRRRLKKVANTATVLGAQLSSLMAEDDNVGEVMLYLLQPEMRRVAPKGRVSLEQLREQIQGVAIAAGRFEAKIGEEYGNKPGRPINQQLNGLVFRLAKIHVSASGRI